MSTKVKGDKIKEGSIPLSALSSEVQGKINGYNLFVLTEDFIEEHYDEPDEDGAYGKVKQVYVTDILENRYNKINVDGVLGDINITDDFIIITTKQEAFQTEEKQESYFEIIIRIQNCKFTNQAYINKSPFVTPLFSTDAADINGDIRYNFVKFVTDSELTIPELTIPEKNKQLFKKNMGSFANWNAQEGEAGYIENKPITKKFIKEQSMEFSDVDEWASVNEGYDAVPSNTTVAKVFADITIYGGGHITTTVIVQKGSYVNIFENYEGDIRISMYNKPEGLTMSVSSAGFSFSGTLKCYYYEEFKQLDEDYIPNTVLKTTPQTLSDEDKNQALANLGIDPVVWKYLCKPYIFTGEMYFGNAKIPAELMKDGKLKYEIPAMYRININDSYVDSSGKPIDFTNINNQYGEYTPEAVNDNCLYTACLHDVYVVAITISPTGTWSIEVTE